jgi:alpha,alpha-trehalose phosphorylase
MYLRRMELKTAVVTSSHYCEKALQAANIEDLFDARVDGEVIVKQHLSAKPAPDYFLTAAQMLKVAPANAVVIEDSISGIQAGARGGVGLVIGVDRMGNAEQLRASGANIVVSDLADLLTCLNQTAMKPAA